MCCVRIVLSGRQRDLLCHVVEEYVTTGQPVGSKTLVERAALPVSPSTVRHELAELERFGLLTHPHTSAGRGPTEPGYRTFANRPPHPPRGGCRPSTAIGTSSTAGSTGSSRARRRSSSTCRRCAARSRTRF